MALANTFSITYGSRTVGGASGVLLNGPYTLDKSHGKLRLVFEIIVSASSHGGLQAECESLEDDFRQRDKGLTISLAGSTWDYEFGDTILNTTSSISKTGNRETDRGYSRAYVVTIEGELPADDTDGLRDMSVSVTFSPSRQRTVTMAGVYTGLEGNTATEQYESDFDSEANTILSALDGSATFEMVSEQHSRDRLDHTCTFTREYVELVADQSSTLNDPQIRDHRVTFTDLSSFPGDSVQDVFRMRRAEGSYSCAVDIEQQSDVQAVWRTRVRDHVMDLFRSEFDPSVFAVEEESVSFDYTSSRLQARLRLIYRKGSGGAGGSEVVEVMQSLEYREQRHIDYTYLHGKDEHSANADAGWSIRDRVWTRAVMVLGNESPKKRITEKAQAGRAGVFDDPIGGVQGIDGRDDGKVHADGWNVIANTSSVTPVWIGNPDYGDQIEHTRLVETVVERFHQKDSGSGGGPITPGGGP